MTALNRKLLRDIWTIKGQASAIAAVVAVGIAMFVAYLSNFDSLQYTLRTYYDRQRFADVFVSLRRAPLHLADRLAAIPGVAVVEPRIVVDVPLDVPGLVEPATGRFVSIAAGGRSLLNDLHVSAGRPVATGRDEVLLSEPFARANHLDPGSRIAAVLNGRRRELVVAGWAFSPEYVYTIRRGEIIPDDRRFGVLWMDQQTLAGAFDLSGSFNDAVLQLGVGADVGDVIAEVDRILAPYGGFGAIPRALQTSNWTINQELNQLRRFGFIVPSVFLGVAAFLLNIALTRALSIQRGQIAALKALGYGNAAIGWHYLKWALLIAGAGAVVGIAAGAWMGHGMLALYNTIYRFPVLLYRLSAGIAMGAGLVALFGSACLGAAVAVVRAIRIPPAEGMRPEPPARYRRSVLERLAPRRLSYVWRMVLRNIERRPVRALATLAGIAFAVTIFFFGIAFMNVMTLIADVHFTLGQRQDLTVVFAAPLPGRVIHELEQLPGVFAAEPVRTVPAQLRFRGRSRAIAVLGTPAEPRLSRVVDLSSRVVALPPSGLAISKRLAEILDARLGDVLEVETMEPPRAVRSVPVSQLIDDALGLSAYMEIGALHDLLREDDRLSAAHLRIDSAQSGVVFSRLKLLPRVAAVSVKRIAFENFQRVMAQNFRIVTTFNVVFALVIAFGVIYNAALVSLSERSRELATLRVVGFTRQEVGAMLLGELQLLTAAALPIGLLGGGALTQLVLASLQNELYRVRLELSARDAAWSALTVIAGAVLSAVLVGYRLRQLDMVDALKTPD